MIRSADIQDASTIAKIYNHYILNEIATFEVEIVNGAEMTRRIKKVIPHLPWLVYEDGSEILGYAYATKWNKRSAYRHSVESTIYLDQSAHSRGIGTLLYKALLDQLSEMKMHTVIGGISLPNEGSVRLHEKFGFKKVAHYKEVGRKFDKWIDVGYWQKSL